MSIGWAAGVFAHDFDPNGYGIELTDQIVGAGTLLSHLGLVPVETELPVAGPDTEARRFDTGTYTALVMYVPHWVLILPLCIAPVRWLKAHSQKRQERGRRAAGFCVHCGYDLRASPTRCPECGQTDLPNEAV